MRRSDRLSLPKPPGPRRALAGVVFGITALALGTALLAAPVRIEYVVLVATGLIAIEVVCARRGVFGRRQEASQRAAPGVASALWAPIVVGLIIIVACFSGALVISQFRIAGAEARATELLSDTIPSIASLASARTALRQLGTRIDDLILAPSSVPTLRGEITVARGQLATSLTAYEALPTIPQEVEYIAEIARELALADELIGRVSAGTEVPPRTLAPLRASIHAHLARADEAVARLTLLNTSFVQTNAEAVIEHRRASVVAAALFGAISIAVAALAALLAIGRVRARARLIDERDRLLAARATELEAFAGRVAHDLRSPLASVALRTAVLLGRCQRDPELRDGLAKLARQSERMAEIIDDLLTFASAGARPLPDATVELRKLMDEVLADFQPAAEAMRAELRIDEFPAMQIACTPAALSCILSNLVGNAVKYLEEGHHPVEWIAIRVTPHGGMARIEVEDTGPGLPPNSEQRVFEPFQRIDASKPGIGLGLATVKKLVEAYGGRVGVHSVLGKGSTFWVELPVAPSPPPAASLPRGGGDQPRDGGAPTGLT